MNYLGKKLFWKIELLSDLVLSNRNIIPARHVIENFPVAILEIKYVSKILSIKHISSIKLLMQYYELFFSTKSSNIYIFYTYSTSQFILLIVQVLNSHVWLMVTILDRAAKDRGKTVKSGTVLRTSVIILLSESALCLVLTFRAGWSTYNHTPTSVLRIWVQFLRLPFVPNILFLGLHSSLTTNPSYKLQFLVSVFHSG